MMMIWIIVRFYSLFTLLFCVSQFGVGGSKASFTPFVDPRVYQTSPSENDEDNSAAGEKYQWRCSPKKLK